MADRQFLEQLSRRLADEGKLIEAGWIGLRMTMPREFLTPTHLDAMRVAFMAGAQHLFASIMVVMEPGTEPTEADTRRLELINTELEAFRQELHLRAAREKGSA